MVRFMKRADGTYSCCDCGKTIQGKEGILSHRSWHRKKEYNHTGVCKTIQKHIDTY